jgi:hypothetical protein
MPPDSCTVYEILKFVHITEHTVKCTKGVLTFKLYTNACYAQKIGIRVLFLNMHRNLKYACNRLKYIDCIIH